MTLLGVLPIALLGGLAGLDTVSFPQAMISRPIVAATLGGVLVGAPAQGLLVGALLELIALETLPVGASRYPEWGSASVVAGATYAADASLPDGSLIVAVLGGLFLAWIGGMTMVKLRQRNARVASRRRAALEAGSRGAVMSVQLAGVAADFVRALVLTGVAYVALAPVERAVLSHWSLGEATSRVVLVGTGASVALGALWKLFHSVSGARWLFVGGLVVASIVLGLR